MSGYRLGFRVGMIFVYFYAFEKKCLILTKAAFIKKKYSKN